MSDITCFELLKFNVDNRSALVVEYVRFLISEAGLLFEMAVDKISALDLGRECMLVNVNLVFRDTLRCGLTEAREIHSESVIIS